MICKKFHNSSFSDAQAESTEKTQTDIHIHMNGFDIRQTINSADAKAYHVRDSNFRFFCDLVAIVERNRLQEISFHKRITWGKTRSYMQLLSSSLRKENSMTDRSVQTTRHSTIWSQVFLLVEIRYHLNISEFHYSTNLRKRSKLKRLFKSLASKHIKKNRA